MYHIYILWIELNWLEFVTYVIIPAAMILMILVYILFNLDGVKLSIGYEEGLLEKIEEKERQDNKSNNDTKDKQTIVNES